MRVYDVVIIGAGPAGLKAAEVLAKNDKKVLVLEKNKIIGPKVCAAGITDKDLEYIPKKLIERRFDSFLLVSNSKIRIEHNLYTIEREKLGQYQFKVAKRAGAIIKTGCIAKKIKDNCVITNKGNYSFDHLIGADGSNSMVRRHLGIKSRFMALGVQYKIPRVINDLEVVFNPKKYKSWYAWIFPHKDYTFIGVATLLNFKESKYIKKILNAFAQQNNFNIKNTKFEAALVNFDYNGFQFKNIFLVGDAAGLANPFTGEGIYQALVSGEEIAKKIVDPNYVCPKLKRIINKNRKLRDLLLVLLEVPGLMSVCYWLGFKFIQNRKFQKKLIKFFFDY